MSCSAQTADLTSNSTKSNRKRKVAEIIAPIKQLYFHGPYIRQNWPFRDSLINYITKNPSNAKAWQKLIQPCKYFFAKNSIFVIDKLECENGSIVPLEKLIAVLPKIKSIFFYEDSDETSITSNTVKKLLELPHFSTIDTFELFNTTEKFDIETFFKYSKKNKHTRFIINFGNSISETYKKRIEEIVDEIIESEKHDYIPANIYY
uniref:Uncharacterized protein n=1 Tax=Panagrolaimus davidi TaxID=227884 RepID=A0A914PV68_9BILA